MSSFQRLFRRFVSMATVSSALAVASCGVDFGGLFDGVDAGPDGAAPADAPQDTGSGPDRATDGRADVTSDITAVEASVDGRGDEIKIDVTADTTMGSDANLDSSSPSDADVSVGNDGRIDGDVAIDASVDGSTVLDGAKEPSIDAVAEDGAGDPSIDTPIEPTIDIRVDTIADASFDRSDAPPGTCGGVCNTFDNIGQTITRTVENGSPPMMTGGTIVDGTYVATEVVQYNGDNAAYVFSETSVISGNYDAWVSNTNGTVTRVMSTFVTSNMNQMTFDLCCPTTTNVTILYTTDGNKLTHIDPANPNRVITYTRQ
jgi:hypothetical protein